MLAGKIRTAESKYIETSKAPKSTFHTTIVVVQTALVNTAVATQPPPTTALTATHSETLIRLIAHVGAAASGTLRTGLLFICIH